jgi:hypothetical protein
MLQIHFPAYLNFWSTSLQILQIILLGSIQFTEHFGVDATNEVSQSAFFI